MLPSTVYSTFYCAAENKNRWDSRIVFTNFSNVSILLKSPNKANMFFTK